MKRQVFFLMFIAVIMFIICSWFSNIQAQQRSRYMDIGDAYLLEADNAWASETRNSYATKALAAYTAAIAEK